MMFCESQLRTLTSLRWSWENHVYLISFQTWTVARIVNLLSMNPNLNVKSCIRLEYCLFCCEQSSEKVPFKVRAVYKVFFLTDLNQLNYFNRLESKCVYIVKKNIINFIKVNVNWIVQNLERFSGFSWNDNSTERQII